ncbi:MAG: hypothetical protein ACWA5R_14915 [bacterium]
MEYLISQTIFALSASLLIGFIMGWLIRGFGITSKINTLTADLNSAQRKCGNSEERIAELEAELKSFAAKESPEPAPETNKANKESVEPTKPAKKEKAVVKKTTEKKPNKESSDSKDDLKKIKGIGPAIEKKLNALGLTQYQQIAKLKTEEIDKINAQLSFKGRIEREEWVKQAKKL